MDRRILTAFVLCALASAIPLVLTGLLPMADLPEHAAQVAILKHFSDPCHGFSRSFELNWSTPYLLGYLAVRVMAVAMPVLAAIKLAVWLTVILLPLALHRLLCRTGGDPWWSLLGFPLAFGFCFYWGFFNFSLAIPLTLFYVAALLGGRPRIAGLTLLALLVLSCHALAFLFCAAVSVAIATIDRSGRKLVPLIVPALILGGWFLRVRAVETAVHRNFDWHLGLYRLRQLPSILFSNETDVAAAALTAVILLGLVLARPRVTRDPRRWVLLGASAILYFFAPLYAFGTAFLFGRFAVFLIPGVLMILEHPARAVRARLVAAVAVVTWMVLLGFRFQGFGEDARGFDEIAGLIPANRRVLTFNVDPFSAHVPGPVFLHFGSYYQVRKGGLVAWSFAANFPTLVRYRPGAEPRVRSGSIPRSRIDWAGVAAYDYIVVRGANPRDVIVRAPYPLVARARRGSWWLFETARARGTQVECVPLE